MTHAVSYRTATVSDVEPLLQLLPQITSRPQSLPALTPGPEEAARILESIAACGNVFIAVAETERALVGALTIAIVPNLTYGGRPWAIIENVVVDSRHRGRGIGKGLMAFAFDLVEKEGCYKAQLLSGPNEDQVGFYRSLGMRDGTSRGFKKYFVER